MRDSFVVYKSFYGLIKLLPTKERLKMFEALFEYGFNETIPTFSSDTATAIWQAILPQLKANQRRYLNGKKGKEYGATGGQYGVLGGRPKNPPKPDFENPPKNPPKSKNKNPPKNPPNENVNVNVNVNKREVIREKFTFNDDDPIISRLTVSCPDGDGPSSDSSPFMPFDANADKKSSGDTFLSKQAEAFRAKCPYVNVDACNIIGKDLDKLAAAIQASSWLKTNQTALSWYLKPQNYEKVIAGYYKDFQAVKKPVEKNEKNKHFENERTYSDEEQRRIIETLKLEEI